MRANIKVRPCLSEERGRQVRGKRRVLNKRKKREAM